MLLWAILLQTVPLKPDDEPVAPAFPRILDLAATDCVHGDCTDQRRYRLDVDSVVTGDAKLRALRGSWRPCGTTGAPVCPSKGRLVLRTDL